MHAARPATRSAHTLFELLFRPPHAAGSRDILLGVFDPADEFIPRERRDVLPCFERRGICDQDCTQVTGKLVHSPTGDSRATHEPTQ